ncbi:MAG: NlpC/P60 family protein [Lachnospirales bacterium]
MKFSKVVALSLSTVMVLGTTVFADNVGVVESSANIVNSESEVVETLNTGTVVRLNEKEGSLYKIDENQYIDVEDLTITRANAIVKNETGLMKYPTDANETLATFYADTTIEVVSSVNDGKWYEVSYGSENGYVKADDIEGDLLEYLKEEEVEAVEKIDKEMYGEITSNNGVVIRSENSADSQSVAKIASGEFVDVKAVSDSWIKVAYNDVDGFVSADFISLHEGEKPEPAVELGKEIVEFGKQFTGTRYVWGGTNLNSGVDCSGFTTAVYRNFGIPLSRTSSSQISNGTRVSRSELVPGDLVFFDTSGSNNGNISHVGIYSGNGKFVHSSTSRGVIVSSLSEGYYSSAFVGGSRIVS